MSLPKTELKRLKILAAHKEMVAALQIAMDKAIIFEKEMEGIHPPTLSQKPALSEKQLAGFLAKSRARRNIPGRPNN